MHARRPATRRQASPVASPFHVCQNLPMLQSARFTPAGSVRSFSYNLLWGCGNVLQKGANACVYLAAGLLQQRDLRTAARIRWGEFGIRINDIDDVLTRWERRTYRELL